MSFLWSSFHVSSGKYCPNSHRHAFPGAWCLSVMRIEVITIAFAVDDVEAVRNAVIANGGGEVGGVVSLDVAGAGRVTFVYVTGPEGNIIELEKWSS